MTKYDEAPEKDEKPEGSGPRRAAGRIAPIALAIARQTTVRRVAIVIAIAGIFGAWMVWRDLETKKPVSYSESLVVTASRLNCRVAPSIDATPLKKLDRGSVVTAVQLERVDGWVKLQIDGTDCWAKDEYLIRQSDESQDADLKGLKSRAEQGDASTQYNLGPMQDNGQGVEQGYAAAVGSSNKDRLDEENISSVDRDPSLILACKPNFTDGDPVYISLDAKLWRQKRLSCIQTMAAEGETCAVNGGTSRLYPSGTARIRNVFEHPKDMLGSPGTMVSFSMDNKSIFFSGGSFNGRDAWSFDWSFSVDRASGSAVLKVDGDNLAVGGSYTCVKDTQQF